MNNKDLIVQYVDTGVKLPRHQINKLRSNDVKTYLRKRLLTHKMYLDGVEEEMDEGMLLDLHELVKMDIKAAKELISRTEEKMDFTYMSVLNFDFSTAKDFIRAINLFPYQFDNTSLDDLNDIYDELRMDEMLALLDYADELSTWVLRPVLAHVDKSPEVMLKFAKNKEIMKDDKFIKHAFESIITYSHEPIKTFNVIVKYGGYGNLETLLKPLNDSFGSNTVISWLEESYGLPNSTADELTRIFKIMGNKWWGEIESLKKY